MKKLLTILGTIALVGTTSINIVACGGGEKPSTQKVDISNKITSPINLGKLSANTKANFLAKLQDKLKTMSDLTTITTSDYNVYKARTKTEIQDPDIIAGTSLNIKIVAKKNKFKGEKDNIIVNYTKNNLQQQDTIYIDKNGNQQTTSEHDLSNFDTSEIIQIGFYKNEKGEIQVVRMPLTVEKIPEQLPSEITNMSSMFDGASVFNQDISSWKVDNVTDMSWMFDGASVFNQNLAKWNTANVTNMSGMFYGASEFNQDISSWKVDNVTDMRSMFDGASEFNQDISSWKVDNVTDMKSMFDGASEFNQDISSWKVDNVTDMSWMFYGASEFNQDISGWDTSKVTNMRSMFRDAVAFNQDISKWNVSSVTNHLDFSTNSGITDDNKLPKFKN